MSIDRVITAALDLGFAHCKIQVRPFEAQWTKDVGGRSKGPKTRTENKDKRLPLIRAQAERLIRRKETERLPYQTHAKLINDLYKMKGAPLTDENEEPIAEFVMPGKRIIQDATRGLLPKLRKKSKARPR